MPRRSDYDSQKEGSMSQQLAALDSDYIDLAGSDPKTSLKIARMRVLGQHGIINLENPTIKLLMDLLNGQRKALFATNEKSSDVTKLGLQMPRSPKVYGAKKDE